MKKSILLIISSCLFISATIFGQSFDSIRKHAESGNPIAEYDFSVMYIKGLGVKQDFNKAFYWMKRSAEQGDGPAQYYLGNMYFKGEGVLADATKAIYWYKKSAEQGFAKAQYSLGVLYFSGTSVQKNLKQSAYWMRKAYNNGLKPAKEMWDKLKLWKYANTTEAKSTNNEVCSSIKSYGDINVCLPIVGGLTECYSNPRIKAIINHLYSSGAQTFMGVYINNIDYKKYKDLNDYRLFDEIIYVFAPNSYKNKPVNYYSLKELDSQMGNFSELDWKELKLKIEKHDNYIFKVDKPILIERYNMNSYCFSELLLAQGKLYNLPVINVKVLNFIEIKHRLLVVVYNLKFNGETSLKEAKAKNNMFVHKFINANK